MPRTSRTHDVAVDLDSAADGLLRILGRLAVEQVELIRVRHEVTGAGARAAVRVAGLEQAQAQRHATRLEQMPCVRRVRVRCAAAGEPAASKRGEKAALSGRSVPTTAAFRLAGKENT